MFAGMVCTTVKCCPYVNTIGHNHTMGIDILSVGGW
jgi:hypothetical protein